MSYAKIFLVDSNNLGNFYFTEDAPNLARHLFALGRYTEAAEFDFFFYEGESAAEELFDLTNNPMRQGEREVRYGRGRSISVGDMVEVDGVFYVCRPNGWQVVDIVLA